MTKADQTERQQAIDQLREWIKPGDTVYTILRHVSRSGMQREISVVLITPEGDLHPNYSVSKACGYRLKKGFHDALVVGGCGFDAGFEIVYTLGRVLWPDGYPCQGKRCHSNDHSNAYYDQRPTDRTDPFWQGFVHQDGGYCLVQRWL